MKDGFQKLTEALEKHNSDQGRYPSVRISRSFWEKYADGVAQLSKEGVNIEVDEDLILEETFIFDDVEKAGFQVYTLNDLKEFVDKHVADGKGDWPVVNMPPDTNTYHKIVLYTIVPNEEPYKGLKLYPSFDGAPDGEHIYVEIGEK